MRADAAQLLERQLDSVRLAIEVEDTGPGIPESQQARIFDSFQQADGGITRSHGGTGLGLAIAKRLAGLMGGDLRLKSTSGKGACFRLVIRLAVSAEDAGRQLKDTGRCFIDQLHHMTELMQLPRLADCGANSENLDRVVETASNKNNPVRLTSEEIRRILLHRL